MSLFKARDWWMTRLGVDEEFDHKCVCVGNLDNDADGQHKIAVGSFNGTLRVFKPEHHEYQSGDMLLEAVLSGPVLQMEIGRFSGYGTDLSIAILHPRTLAVVKLESKVEKGEHGSSVQCEMHLLYEIPLDRTPFNFCFGEFGGNKGKDMICVQSLDGQLSIYEAEVLVFTRFLQNFLVPGPLCYVPRIDALVTCNSQFDVECYKFKSLQSASSSNSGTDAFTRQKAVQVDWKAAIGEMAIDICVGRLTRSLPEGDNDIIVLAEHTLFFLRETGAIRMQKRLDYHPTCAIPFPGKEPGFHHLLVGTFDNSVMVYQDTQLIWSASLDTPPISLHVCSFSNLNGLIVALDDDATIRVCYLGTEPQLSVVGAVDNKELDYEDMDEEHRRLLGVIKQATSSSRSEPPEVVTIRAQVPQVLDADGSDSAWHRQSVTCRVFITYDGPGSIDDVSLTVNAPYPFEPAQRVISIPTLNGSRRTPLKVPVTLRCIARAIPSSLDVDLLATFLTANGEPRSSSGTMRLPFCFVAKATDPVKNAAVRVTVSTNRPPPSLPQLFDDIIPPAAKSTYAQNSMVLSMAFHNGADATILVSKNAGRYRVQSSVLEALGPVLDELGRRLGDFFMSSATGGDAEPFAISLPDQLPTSSYFDVVSDHFACRKEIAEMTEQLADRAREFRGIQKRLIVRFKDRNPGPLQSLDVMLDSAYQTIVELGNKVEEAQDSLVTHSSRLAACTHAILLMIRFRHDLTDEAYDILRSHWTPVVPATESEGHGWEEQVELALTHLLRTNLSKTASKDGASLPHTASALKDVTKLKKLMSMVLDRLEKGIVLKPDG